jgi:hypothetical protein
MTSPPLPLSDDAQALLAQLKAELAQSRQRTIQSVALLDRDVEQRLYEQATTSSAAYVLENMLHAMPMRPGKFTDRGRSELLEHALARLPEEGFCAEFGVFRGASLAFIAHRIDRVIYGLDSFEGMPEPWGVAGAPGAFGLGGVPPQISTPNDNFRLVQGMFSDSIPRLLDAVDGPAAFVHLDCRIYSSTRDALNGLADRLAPGAVLVFGQYFNYPGWQKEQARAFREFCEQHGRAYQYLAYATQGSAVAVVMA